MIPLQTWTSIHTKLLIAKANIPIIEEVVSSLNLSLARAVAAVILNQSDRGCNLCREAGGAASVEPVVVPVTYIQKDQV